MHEAQSSGRQAAAFELRNVKFKNNQTSHYESENAKREGEIATEAAHHLAFLLNFFSFFLIFFNH